MHVITSIGSASAQRVDFGLYIYLFAARDGMYECRTYVRHRGALAGWEVAGILIFPRENYRWVVPDLLFRRLLEYCKSLALYYGFVSARYANCARPISRLRCLYVYISTFSSSIDV
jgi:hypothetical protein